MPAKVWVIKSLSVDEGEMAIAIPKSWISKGDMINQD